MVCKNCGEYVNEKFEYCPYCGDFLDKSQYMENDIVYKIYPTCNIWTELIPDLKTILILVLLTFINFYFQDFLLLNEYYSPNYIWILYIIVFLWYDMKAMMKKLRFQKIEYCFYKDHLEYHEQFGRRIMHSVRYDTISDVAIHQSWIDSMFHRGTLALYTANREDYGIYIYDVPNVEEVYYQVKKMIDSANHH